MSGVSEPSMAKYPTVRMRHEAARRRTLTVAEKRQLTPNYLSILFRCDDFEDFVSAGADDHIKLFLAGERTADGRPPMRDYTPRSFDPEKREFVIEFALHAGPGPATAWAIDAKVGDQVQIGGPRGSVVVPDSYDWYWLIGDETAIPAIARRLEESPSSTIRAFIAVDGGAEELTLPTAPAHRIDWVHRSASQAGDPGALLEAISGEPLPAGDGFVWIAAEATVAKALREVALAKGHPQTQMKSAGYWTKGAADTTARFD